MGLDLEPRGFENSIKVRMIYLDTKEQETFISIAAANRKTNINAKTIRDALNPLAKKRFEYKGRTIVFRVLK
jgi:DNA-binding IscR family transcriptional regulator